MSQSPRLSLERIFVKDVSFEVPHPDVFTKEWNPEIDIKLESGAQKLDGDYYEVTLKAIVTAQNDGKNAYIAEVQEAGIFLLQDIPEAEMPQILSGYCPNILFPYVREMVTDLVNRGSFPQLLLAPVNFDHAFLQAKARAQQTDADA